MYFVRGETSARNHTDSPSIGISIKLNNAVISAADSINWLNMIYTLGGRRKHTLSHANEIVLKEYEGREYPVPCISKQKKRSLSTKVMFESRSEAEAFMGLSGKVIIYKDVHGVVICGVVQSPSMEYENGISPYVYSVGFTLIQTDFREVDIVE